MKTGPKSYHGSAGGYSNHRCRCAECRAAWAKWKKDYDRRRIANGDYRDSKGWILNRPLRATATRAMCDRIQELEARLAQYETPEHKTEPVAA